MATPTPAIDWETIRAAIAAWVQAGSLELDEAHVIWDQQGTDTTGTMSRPSVPYAELSMPGIATPAHDFVTKTKNPLTFAAKPVTGVDLPTGKLTVAGHGLANGDGPVRIASSGTVPGGLAINTDYWPIFVDANTVQLAATFVETGGVQPAGAGNPKTPIAPLLDAGTGTITLVATADTVPAGKEILRTAQGIRGITVRIQVFGAEGSGANPNGNDALRLITNILSSLPLHVDELDAAGIGMSEVGTVDIQGKITQLDGRVGGVLEPRAICDVSVFVTSKMTGTLARVDRVRVSSEATFEDGTQHDVGDVWVPTPPT